MRSTALLLGALALACISCGTGTVTYAEARGIVDRRCVGCHSERPTSKAFPFPPKGVVLDNAQQMKQYAARIEATVADGSMPLANLSGMTDKERRLLEHWVETGAKIP